MQDLSALGLRHVGYGVPVEFRVPHWSQLPMVFLLKSPWANDCFAQSSPSVISFCHIIRISCEWNFWVTNLSISQNKNPTRPSPAATSGFFPSLKRRPWPVFVVTAYYGLWLIIMFPFFDMCVYVHAIANVYNYLVARRELRSQGYSYSDSMGS